MKNIILLLSLMFTFTASAQYGILSAVQLNEGAEDQYLALEAFFGPVHDLAIEKGIENFQAVWKVTSDSTDENAPHYIIYTGFESKEQLDAYNNSWTSEDWVALAKEAHKGSISASRVERIMNNVSNESKERRNYHLMSVDNTVFAGSIEPGDIMTITPTKALNDDFENYETKFWKPYIEKAILMGQHRYWGLSKVYERTENAYEGMTHFFFNFPVEGSNWWDGVIDQDSFEFQKLQEGLNAASEHSDPITLELVSVHN